VPGVGQQHPHEFGWRARLGVREIGELRTQIEQLVDPHLLDRPADLDERSYERAQCLRPLFDASDQTFNAVLRRVPARDERPRR
jgi:hypothetical protein